jgi:hypothetical protein
MRTLATEVGPVFLAQPATRVTANTSPRCLKGTEVFSIRKAGQTNEAHYLSFGQLDSRDETE